MYCGLCAADIDGPLQTACRVSITVGCLSVHPSVRLSVCPIDRRQRRRPASLLVSEPCRQEISIDSCGRRRRVPVAGAHSSKRRSAANAGSVTLTAEERGSTQTSHDLYVSSDEKLFSKLLTCPNHIPRALLPPPTAQNYSLRNRPHNRQLPDRISRITALLSECCTAICIDFCIDFCIF